MCPRITDGPTCPGVTLPVYQPATWELAGTSTVPSALRPSGVRPDWMPMLGMAIDVGSDGEGRVRAVRRVGCAPVDGLTRGAAGASMSVPDAEAFGRGAARCARNAPRI